jgi:hypothetical protein
MQTKRFVPSFALVAFAACLGGCAGNAPTVQTAAGPMPQYCVYSNTATGAVVGAGAGAALGGGGLRSLVGAAIGAGAGAAAGSRLDEECRQLALQRAMDLAAQQAAARAAAPPAVSENQPPPPQPAVYQSPIADQPPPRPIAYQPVDYVTPSNHRHHRIVALKSYRNPVTKQTCNTYSEFTFSDNGKPQISGSGTACKGADGVWRG